MLKSILSSTALALVLAMPGTANAQAASGGASGSSCPPGSWFCAEAPQQQAAPAGKPVRLEPLPDPDEAPAPSRTTPPPPPVVVYQPPPPSMSPPPYEY